jgi:hypothetical protein
MGAALTVVGAWLAIAMIVYAFRATGWWEGGGDTLDDAIISLCWPHILGILVIALAVYGVYRAGFYIINIKRGK